MGTLSPQGQGGGGLRLGILAIKPPREYSDEFYDVLVAVLDLIDRINSEERRDGDEQDKDRVD